MYLSVLTIPTSSLSLRRSTSGWRRISVIVPSWRRRGWCISRHTQLAYSFRHIREQWALRRQHYSESSVGATSSRRWRFVSTRGSRVTSTTRRRPRTDRSARLRNLIRKSMTRRTSSIFGFRRKRLRGHGFRAYFPSRNYRRVTRGRSKVSATHTPGRRPCAPTSCKRPRWSNGLFMPTPSHLRRTYSATLATSTRCPGTGNGCTSRRRNR